MGTCSLCKFNHVVCRFVADMRPLVVDIENV